MQAIYKPTGRALEYAELATNTYLRCPFRCSYCYVPATLHMSREEFAQSTAPRTTYLPALERDAAKLPAGAQVFMNFLSDPYQPIEKVLGQTRQAIQILHAAGHSVNILTKAGALAQRDFDLLGPKDKFGVTLTSMAPSIWEPNAAPPMERLGLLIVAWQANIPTWVSLEPVMEPVWTLDVIRQTSRWVDEFKVGTWNHDVRAKAIDWHRFAHDVTELLDSLGKRYTLKQDLRKWL